MKEITVWMIVQSNNSKYIDNFNTINQQVQLRYFPAIQSTEHYQIYSDFAVHKNYFCSSYMQQFEGKETRLGDNLSHMLLFNEILEKSTSDWNLVLDGSVTLQVDRFLKDYEDILTIADENNCLFIQLYMHTKFFNMNKTHQYLDQKLYNLSIQTDNKAFLIHKKGIAQFIDKYPLRRNVNEQLGEMIPSLKSLYWKNDFFHVM